MKKLKRVYGYFDDRPDKEVLHTGSESKVQHHQAEQCDMKTIINSFLKTGEMPHLSNKEMQFIDATEATEYDKSLQLVLDAQDTFAELPAKVRNRFDNDPRQLLMFMDDPSNLDEAIELGLAERRQSVDSPSVDVDHPVETSAVSPKGEQGGDSQASVA